MRFWNAITAARVCGPKTPSAGIPSARCTGATHGARNIFIPPEPARASAARVWGPTIPSTRSPCLRWKERTAARVFGPKIPSAVMPSLRCTDATSGPREPKRSRRTSTCDEAPLRDFE